MAESRDLEELMTRIKNTIYGEAVSDVQKPYTSQGIESALRGHLADVHYSIAKTAGDSPYSRCILYEIYCIKSKTNSQRKSSWKITRRD